MIKTTIKGDLVKLAKEGYFNTIVHGCNCFCTMGAGIAKQIKKEFPKVYEQDKSTVKGDVNKLGDYSECLVGIGTGVSDYIIVINAYTQYTYWEERPVEYSAIRDVFSKLNTQVNLGKIGIPMIGAGLAGGDWKIIESIINETTPNLDITLVEYDGN